MNIGSYNDDAQEAATRATIWQYNADGSGGRVFARGLRNTVGFGWDLTTGLMWGVDNQSDNLGTGYPPDELNQIQDGGDYGYPFCVGNQEPNPNIGRGQLRRDYPACARFSSPFRAAWDGVLLGARGIVPGFLLGRAVRGPAQYQLPEQQGDSVRAVQGWQALGAGAGLLLDGRYVGGAGG